MNIDDRQLEEWLREVEVPQDLAERLRSLSDSASQVARPPRWPWFAAASVLAVAASIAAIVLFVNRTDSPNAAPLVAENSNPTTEATPANVATPNALASETPPSLEEIRAEVEMIDRLLRQRTILDLGDKLAALSDRRPATSLESNQRASLIVSLSDQAAIDLGASRQSVAQDMARVIERFPNTRGAAVAEQFIAQHNIQ